MKILARALAALAAVALFGCHNGGSDQNSAQVRYLNAVSDAEPLDMLMDGNVTASAVALGTVTTPSELGSGTHDFKVRSSTSQAILVDKSIAISSATNNTILVFGKRAAINSVVVPEDTTSPSVSTNYRMQAINLSPDAGTLDLYVAPGDVTTTSPTITGLGYGTLSSFVEAAAGSSMRIMLTTTGTKNVVFQSGTLAIAGNTSYTLVISPSGSGALVNAILLVNGGSSTVLTNPLGRLKGVNAIPDSTPVNFKADGTTLLSAVPFTGASTYVTTSAGSRTLQLEASAVPGTIIASTTQNVAPAVDYTMLALGSFAAPQIKVLTDDNSTPPAGLVKIRFVNAMNSATAVDALIDFASAASGIAPGTASGYSAISPKLDYTITFTTPGGVNQIATLTPVELDVGNVYTAYLFGTPSNATAKLVRDR